MDILTIGHSSRFATDFADLLIENNVQHLVDVRGKWAGSRKFPWFNPEPMQDWLYDRAINYTHMPSLGGWRSKNPTVDPNINVGWRSSGMKNYADYATTSPFAAALKVLMQLASTQRVAIMCAEAVPWRCHRLLISNVLTANDVNVYHIINKGQVPKIHELNRWGAMSIKVPSTQRFGITTLNYPAMIETKVGV